MTDAFESKFITAAATHKGGDRDAAARLLEELISQWPARHEAHYLLGMVRFEQGSLVRAGEHLRQAVELDQSNPEYLFRYGVCLRRAGKPEEGADQLERAVEQSDDALMLFLELGAASLAARRYSRAEWAFEQALRLDPRDLFAMLGLSRALQMQHRAREAIEVSRSTIAEHPSSAEALSALAAMLERGNDAQEARTLAERALKSKPDLPAAHLTLAKIFYRAKEFEQAESHLRTALAGTLTEEQSREVHRMLGLVLDQTRRYDEAYDHFVQSKPDMGAVPRSHRATAERGLAFVTACRTEISAEVVGQWSAPPGQRPTPVFFVGFPRSGTTLLEQMLGAHPQVVTTDELPMLPSVRDRLSMASSRPELIPSRLSRLGADQITKLRGIYWGETERSIPPASLRGKLLIDKHPLNTPNLSIVRRIFPGAKVIMALRDPRDVVLSCFTMLNRTPIAVSHFKSLESTAKFYAAIMDLWLHYKVVLGLPWIEQRYEDLVEDPEGQMRRILEFLELPWDDSVMRFTEKTGGKRLRSASYQQVTQGIHKRAKGRWQNYEKHYGPALEILQPYLKALGYED